MLGKHVNGEKAATATCSQTRKIQPAAYYANSHVTSKLAAANAATQLQQHGYAVIDNFLSRGEVEQLRSQIFYDGEENSSAKIKFTGSRQPLAIRSDRVSWLHEDDCPEKTCVEDGCEAVPHDASLSLRSAILQLKAVGAALMEAQQAAARRDQNGIGSGSSRLVPLEVPTRCMLAWYPPATPTNVESSDNAAFVMASQPSGYRPHRDNVSKSFMDDDGGWTADREQADREITAILYLTPPMRGSWTSTMGGALRLFVGAAVSDHTGETCAKAVDLMPEPGRLVLFHSRTMLHEVQAVRVHGRLALSCWLLSDPLAKLNFLKS